jgi:hypothetical protein
MVYRNTINPCRQTRFSLERGNAAEDIYKNFLCKIVRVGIGTGISLGERADPRSVDVDEFLHRVSIARRDLSGYAPFLKNNRTLYNDRHNVCYGALEKGSSTCLGSFVL